MSLTIEPVANLTDVERELALINTNLSGTETTHIYFVTAYYVTTQALHQFLEQHQDLDDPNFDWCFYNQLSASFAQRYLDQAYELVNAKPTTQPWRTVFEVSKAYDDIGLAITAGLMAHIHFDLPLAIATALEQCPTCQKTFNHARKKAYVKMDSIIAGAIKSIVIEAFKLRQQRKEVDKYDFYYGKLHRKMNDTICHIYISMLIKTVRREALWHYYEIKDGYLSTSQLSDLTTKRIHMLGTKPGLTSFMFFLLMSIPPILFLGCKRLFRTQLKAEQTC